MCVQKQDLKYANQHWQQTHLITSLMAYLNAPIKASLVSIHTL